MSSTITLHPSKTDPILSAAEAATAAIPPAWPLSATVAVNPFLGQADLSLEQTGARLGRLAGARLTLPRSWFRSAWQRGQITRVDLEEAVAANHGKPSVNTLLEALERENSSPRPLPMVSDLATRRAEVDWTSFVSDRIGQWAQGYFDQGQALWAASRKRGAYGSWRGYAMHDLSPQIAGLRDFSLRIEDAPRHADDAIRQCVHHLGLAPEALQSYFHQLLLDLGGWSQYARGLLWTAQLNGRHDSTLLDLLAIRLLWEDALHHQYRQDIAQDWAQVVEAHARPLTVTPDLQVDVLLQDAMERAAQRRLAEQLRANPQPSQTKSGSSSRPTLQAAFCIDVRSERFRRALEAQDQGIQTLGFAGFFGLAAEHRALASDVPEARAPVLLQPALKTRAGGPESAQRDTATRLTARAKRAWGRFKLAAVSSFAFVEAMGPVYISRLLRDSLGIHSKASTQDPPPRLDPELGLDQRITAAATVLRAMSLSENFAPLVLLAGHGAAVVNNPHASALQCGACGGYSGEVNARLLASLLNDPDVRQGLSQHGIDIPADTQFLPALHDTTSDTVKLYNDDLSRPLSTESLEQVQAWLHAAGRLCRAERATSLPRAGQARSLLQRGQDWAEVRPEWALAGCQFFIAAPRNMTKALRLDGRAFLHDYAWRNDAEFQILELILTAPVVVASWISLQYYGSCVAPELFGAGNKLLHNVVGGIGVVEGNGGRLRAGLPWQSVHDGEQFMHQPQRLSVAVAAPAQAVDDILRKHPGVAALFGQRWLHLFLIDDQGCLAQRFSAIGEWEPMQPEEISRRHTA